MSDYVLRIHSKNQKIFLFAGSYHILIIGGHTVDEHGFSISFINSTSGRKINIERAPVRWNVLYRRRQKAKHYYSLKVRETGEYEVHFRNPETLVVYRSQLWSLRKLQGPIDNSKIKIAIAKKG